MLKGLPGREKNTQYNALVAMLVATAIWGFAPPIVKYTLDYIPPLTFLFYRFLIVCLILFPYVYLELRKQNVRLSEFPSLVVSGLLGQTALIFFFVGLKYTSSMEVAIMGIMAPLLMVVSGHYFFNEKVNRHIQIGLVIITIGTIFLTLEPILDSQGGPQNISKILGNILIIIYNLLWTAHVMWSKRIRGENSHKVDGVAKFFGIHIPRRKYSSELVTGISFYVGLITLIPFYLLESTGSLGSSGFSITNLSTSGWVGLLYMALLSSIVAYGLFEWSLKYLKVTDTVIFSYISPIFTLPAAFFILGEVPSRNIIIGAVIITVGILVAEKKKG